MCILHDIKKSYISHMLRDTCHYYRLSLRKFLKPCSEENSVLSQRSNAQCSRSLFKKKIDVTFKI